jgi:hypothetical protein
MITEISFYDFDGTLFDTYEPEEGKKIYKEKTGDEYPHKGWWGRKESLDLNIFNIKANNTVYSKWLSDSKNGNVKTVLLTNRLYKLKNEVLMILTKNNMIFDEYSFKKGGADKVERILSNIDDNIKTINIYDDREKELVEFDKFKEDYTDKYNINVFRVVDNTLQENFKINISQLINEEIDKFIK